MRKSIFECQALFALLNRESRRRRGRLLFFVACLSLGVCAVVGTSSLVRSIRDGLQNNARLILGADLVVESRRELPSELDGKISSEHRRLNVVELPTMVRASEAQGGKSRLAELVAADGPYPLYGAMITVPAIPVQEIFSRDGVIVEQELLDTLGLSLGDDLFLGRSRLKILAVASELPGRSTFSFMLGPRVVVSRQALKDSGLMQFGSRVKYRAFFAFDDTKVDAEALSDVLKDELTEAPWLTFKTPRSSQPTLERVAGEVEKFLGLVALMSLVLGAIGVARIVKAWLEGSAQTIAILRCLGLRPIEVACVHLAQVAILAFLGSLAGGLLGSLVPRALAWTVPEVFDPKVMVFWQPGSLVLGLGLGMAVALLFSLPAMTVLWQVSPARVFRTSAAPLKAPRGILYASWTLLGAGLFVAAWIQGGDALSATIFSGGLAATLGLLALAAWILRRFLRVLPRSGLHPYLRHGLTSLTRPGTGMAGALIALGLGVFVIVAILMTASCLQSGVRQALPKEAPSAFFVDVQPQQWPDMQDKLRAEGASYVDSTPVVMGRLLSVDGIGVKELSAQSENEPRRRNWALTREQRLTWWQDLPQSNDLVAGELWADPEHDELSLEEKFAKDIHAEIGSVVVFDIQGIKKEFLVTSLRRVRWESFAINFFLVAEPGALDEAPHYRIAVARLAEDEEVRIQNELAEVFPNVSMIRVRSIIDKLAVVLTQLATGIGLLGSFTALAGLAILVGCVSGGAVGRAKEMAILKTIGVTPKGAFLLVLVEFGALGLVAGLIGTAAGAGASSLFSGFQLELVGAADWRIAGVAVVAAMIVAALAGAVANLKVLATPPRVALAEL